MYEVKRKGFGTSQPLLACVDHIKLITPVFIRHLSVHFFSKHTPKNQSSRLDETEARYRQREAERKRKGQGEEDEELEEGGEYDDL